MTEVAITANLDCVDFFAGVGRVTQECKDLGLKAVSYERDNSTWEDFLSPIGLVVAMILVMRLKQGGLSHWGTVCSSWIWISRNTMGRSTYNPLGFNSVPSCRQGNIMVSRMALLLFVVVAKDGVWMLEQPRSSIWTSILGWCRCII